MNLFKTIKARLFASFAVFAGLMVVVALIAVIIFDEFGSVTRIFINESLPELEDAYALEQLAHNLSVTGPLMIAAPNRDALLRTFEESKVTIETLHKLTATLSAKGIYGDLLSLNRHSQGMLSNLNMILAVKTKLLKLRGEFDRSMADTVNLFKEIPSREFDVIYHQLHQLSAIKTESDITQLQSRFETDVQALTSHISNGSTEQMVALVNSAVAPFSIRKEEVRLNRIVASSLARLKMSTDGILENAQHYRKEVSKSAHGNAASVLELENQGTIAIMGLSALMFCVAILVGWLFVAKGIVARLSTLSTLMLRDPKQATLPTTTITGDDEIGDMGRAVETFLERSNALALAQTALDQTEDSVFMFKPDTLAFFYVNEGASRHLGYSRDELLRMTPFELKPLYTEDAFRNLLSPLLSNDVSSLTFETLHRHKDGHDISVEILLQHIHLENAPSFLMAIVRDVSLQLQTEQELRKAKQEAEYAQKTAEQANQAKSEFLSSMSHELRTPLNGILGFAQLLDYDPAVPLHARQKDKTDQIIKSGNHLLQLIDQVLELAKIEAGKISVSIESFPIREVVEECIPLIKTMAEKRSIVLNADIDDCANVLVCADRTRLRQVILNLLSNAVKYNCEDGSISLTGKIMENDMIRIAVSDTGLGIPEDQKDKLFQPFERLGRESSEIEGTGIGLTITRELVHVMCGEIGFESDVGKGSTFWIEIPLDKKEHAEDHIKISENADHDTDMGVPVGDPETTYVVLYVEDNPANLMLMEEILSIIPNINMISTHTAELGIEMARAQRPDLILMDINLPGMNGDEALARLKANSETRDIPVFAVTAAAMPYQVKQGLEQGFLAYVTKPLQVDTFLQTVRDTLSKSVS